jgi:hypothetical protein
LRVRGGLQKRSGDSAELGAQDSFADADVFGYGDADNLIVAHGRIILLAAVAAGDENVAARVGANQAVQAEAVIALNENNVSAAQARLRGGLHVNHFAVTNCGRHAGAASLEANAQTGLKAVEAEGLELLRLRTVFCWPISSWTIFFWTILFWTVFCWPGVCAISRRPIGTGAISHGS